jgi:hypothetical protein
VPTYRYHWTHRANLASIARDGLDPAHSRGRLKVVWSCEAGRVLWAVGHVSAHHECSPDDMVLLRIRADGLPFVRSSWPMVATIGRKIAPSRIAVVPFGMSGRATPIRHAVTPSEE